MKKITKYLAFLLILVLFSQQTNVLAFAEEVISEAEFNKMLSDEELAELIGDEIVSSSGVEAITEEETENISEIKTEATTTEIADGIIGKDVELYTFDISSCGNEVKKIIEKYDNFNMLDDEEKKLFNNSMQLRPELRL